MSQAKEILILRDRLFNTISLDVRVSTLSLFRFNDLSQVIYLLRINEFGSLYDNVYKIKTTLYIVLIGLLAMSREYRGI